MTYLSTKIISAAKQNDIDAVSAVIAETEKLVSQRAHGYATGAGRTDHHLAEDLAQAGRITVWKCLSTFKGETGAKFMAYIERELHTTMRDLRQQTLNPGVSEQTAKDFELALALALGDPYDAVRVATTEEMGPRKMSPGRAHAALLSWLGVDSLDRPHGVDEHGDDMTMGDVVAAVASVPADLLDTRDYETTRCTVIRDQVHCALGALGERQRHVLKASHGISPVADYSERPDVELAEDMGVTVKAVKEARAKGQKRFSELYRAGARTW
ncbi:sigma-70 family RNA polymerase sigma factor [Streptomyces zagrosensis]|uniref:RNA polymerase sigma factor (Sigma-70 family) n=1 Tax=Streptomyces zagrosensis TaxID=1042984 RepID=A0A7W9UYA1_9ACTN|nr:sigma-70 family RNA polymerase sigma factor [Streptomyces zagrosensis]MBB5934589.1 RNA polymerase sigma factor (sigma-70 family) [Streptomyces zagrosensis]